MWLLSHLSKVGSAAVHAYYRASRDGEAVADTGPVILVGNHPNSLLDPAFLVWVAQRPVRFLAKAPLFKDPLIGWLVRGSGSIPVYRRQDDATQMDRNDEAFAAVRAALHAGAAVALFPEGISHSEPGLTPLKTGAARIALGAANTIGRTFPIVPVGLVFRAKDRFRSAAHAVVGSRVQWDDLLGRGEEDQQAVRDLTARIEQGMRQVTLNLARWEDESVVRTAEAVWGAAHNADQSPAARVTRLARTTDTLARLRVSNDPRWDTLARDVREHGRELRDVGIRAQDLETHATLGAAARWALRRLTLVGITHGALAIVTIVLFWIPYRITGIVAGLMTRDRDTISTYRVLTGAVLFLLWIAALAAAAGLGAGWWGAVGAVILLPVIAITGLHAAESSRWTLLTARRWLTVRSSDARVDALRERQRDLSRRLDAALAAHPDTE